MRLSIRKTLDLALAIALVQVGPATGGLLAGPPRLGTFVCDVTPPLGHPLCGGWIEPLKAVDDPLLAKGVVFEQGGRRYVICAVDWCLLQTGAYDAFSRKLAEGARTDESRVSVHTVHQHTAPIADSDAQRLLDQTMDPPPHLDLEFLAEVTDRLAAAAREACGRLRPITGVGQGQAKVFQFASNRRVRLADGMIHMRSSSTQDPMLQAAPEGLIDPWLKTVTFYEGDELLVRLHFYASHPQSYYGDGRATSDTAGLARERLEREERVPQIYFTGCGGNIAAGKYNDGSPRARLELTGRLFTAMKASIASSRGGPVDSLDWRSSRVRFTAREESEWSPERSREVMEDRSASALSRLKSALNLAWSERLDRRAWIELHRLRVGEVNLLFLPGEAFVEYQLYAQSLRPGGFVAVAAYGESGPGYICTDASLNAGGYEPTMSRVGPPSEWALKQGIAALLADGVRQPVPPPYPDKLHLLAWRDRTGRERPVTRPSEWARRREHIVASMESVMGREPRLTRDPPLNIRAEEEAVVDDVTRHHLTYQAEAGDRVPAYLFVPREANARLPAMLCLHQTTAIGKGEPAGLGGRENLRYALELARRGYVTLAPDYPNFGDYVVDPYAAGYASATMKGIRNHRRAVDLLASRAEVDPERIGVIGHSLGGHNALFLAVFEPRIKVVITSCGFNSFFKYYGGDLTGWSHRGYMPRIADLYHHDPKEMPFDFTEVLAAIAPRPVFINAPMADANFEVSGVKDCVIAAEPVYRLLAGSVKERLVAAHPDCGHDFPPEVRAAAYGWLDDWLGVE